jgi:hypothetical protein
LIFEYRYGLQAVVMHGLPHRDHTYRRLMVFLMVESGDALEKSLSNQLHKPRIDNRVGVSCNYINILV